MANTPDQAAAAPAKDRKKLMMIGAVVLVVAGGAYFKLGKSADPAAAAVPGAAPAAVAAPVEGAIVEIGSLTVNLSAPQLHYARVNFSVVLSEGTPEDVVRPKFPLLKDAAITEVGRSTPDALVTTEGVDDLRARLTERAREIYPPDVPEGTSPVLRIIFTELVVQ